MKIPLPPSLPAPEKTPQKDPFHRLSLAVQKLDQLINRAHQLGTFSGQLLRDDKTGARLPSLEPNLSQPSLPRATEDVPTPGNIQNNIEDS